MGRIEKITDGAYFVPSYSEQTIVAFQPGLTTQTVITATEDTETVAPRDDDELTEDCSRRGVKETLAP